MREKHVRRCPVEKLMARNWEELETGLNSLDLNAVDKRKVAYAAAFMVGLVTMGISTHIRISEEAFERGFVKALKATGYNVEGWRFGK